MTHYSASMNTILHYPANVGVGSTFSVGFDIAAFNARANAAAEARVHTPEFQKRLARRRKAAVKWHATHES
jgi:hypothetical protein